MTVIETESRATACVEGDAACKQMPTKLKKKGTCPSQPQGGWDGGGGGSKLI